AFQAKVIGVKADRTSPAKLNRACQAPGMGARRPPHDALHRWMPLREAAVRGVGTALSGGSLPLPRLPQASRRALRRFGSLSRRSGGDRGGGARLWRALLLPDLWLLRLRAQRG